MGRRIPESRRADSLAGYDVTVRTDRGVVPLGVRLVRFVPEGQGCFGGEPGSARRGQKFAAQESDILNRTSTIIASLRPDFVQIRPGYGVQFGEMLRESRAAHEKAQMKEDSAVYVP